MITLMPKIKMPKTKTVRIKHLEISLFVGILLLAAPQSWTMEHEQKERIAEQMEKLEALQDPWETALAQDDTSAMALLLPQVAGILPEEEEHQQFWNNALSSACLHAMEHEQKSSTREEIEQRLMPLCEQIETAFEKSDLDAMAFLISQVARVSPPEENLVILNATLQEALLKGKLDIADLLIQHKANPNYTLKDELPPLIDIARKGSAQAVNFLLEAGADPEQEAIVNSFKANALCAGLFNDNNYIPITKLLLKKINVNCRVQNQATPLHLVASSLKRTIPMALLLEHRADPNAKDQTGGTPLDYALNASNEQRLDYKFKAILLLHVYGADITREYWQHLQHFFLNSDIAHIMRERAQRESDLVCINALCTPEQQQALTFKESYKSALNQIIARFLTELPTALAPLVADYATYDPVIDFELRDEPGDKEKVEIKRMGKRFKKRRHKAGRKNCAIQ